MESDTQETTAPKWKPIPRMHRRVLGVLVEKAKTTPNGYPLSLNAIVTGSNQKSNRFPQMDLTPEDAEEALEELRGWGATGEVHGDGRVVKFRHYMKDWLGVDGTELAVMAELLLRGAQTVGELRGRAARMAGPTLRGMSELKPVLDSLVDKKLVISLTPPGRGQVVTHALYLESEMSKVMAEHSSPGSSGSAPAAPMTLSHPSNATQGSAAQTTTPNPTNPAGSSSAVQKELEELRREVARLSKEIEDIWENISS